MELKIKRQYLDLKNSFEFDVKKIKGESYIRLKEYLLFLNNLDKIFGVFDKIGNDKQRT